MGQQQQKAKENFIPNKDTLIHTLQFLPLKNALRLSILSKSFQEIIDSEEMYSSLLKTHNIFIVTNNRTYNTSTEKLLKNILWDSKDKRTFPDHDYLVKISNYNKSGKGRKSEKFCGYSTLERLGDIWFYFPQKETKYMVAYHAVLEETLHYFEQFVKYNVDPKSQYCIDNTNEIKSELTERMDAVDYLIKNMGENNSVVWEKYRIMNYDEESEHGFGRCDAWGVYSRFRNRLFFDDFHWFSRLVYDVKDMHEYAVVLEYRVSNVLLQYNTLFLETIRKMVIEYRLLGQRRYEEVGNLDEALNNFIIDLRKSYIYISDVQNYTHQEPASKFGSIKFF